VLCNNDPSRSSRLSNPDQASKKNGRVFRRVRRILWPQDPEFYVDGNQHRGQAVRVKNQRLAKGEMPTRFISFEPLIGAVGTVNLNGNDWAIIGGESGHRYREVKKEWIEEIIAGSEGRYRRL